MNVGYPTLEGAAIPGDPEGLDAIASRLQSAQADIASVQDRVAANELAGWRGAAAERFRSSLEKLPGELGSVAVAFEHASGAIRRFASELTGFQHDASYYANRIKSMEEELHSSQRRHDEAQAKLAAARLRESAATEPISLKTAVNAVTAGLSKLRLALDAVEANRGELEKLRREAQTNREDYEQAVNTCANELGDSAHVTHSGGAAHIGIMGLIGGLAALVERHHRGMEDGGEDLYHFLGHVDGVNTWLSNIDKFVELTVPVSDLGGWATPLVRYASSPATKMLGHAMIPVQAFTDYESARGLWAQTSGDDAAGRDVARGQTLIEDGLEFYPPIGFAVGVANFADGGALDASLNGLALISGGFVSGGTEGALKADNQFATMAAGGGYGWPVKEIARGENNVIGYAAPGIMSASHHVADGVGDASHAVGHFFSDL
jgi:uncharacterized protein YukE